MRKIILTLLLVAAIILAVSGTAYADKNDNPNPTLSSDAASLLEDTLGQYEGKKLPSFNAFVRKAKKVGEFEEEATWKQVGKFLKKGKTLAPWPCAEGDTDVEICFEAVARLNKSFKLDKAQVKSAWAKMSNYERLKFSRSWESKIRSMLHKAFGHVESCDSFCFATLADKEVAAFLGQSKLLKDGPRNLELLASFFRDFSSSSSSVQVERQGQKKGGPPPSPPKDEGKKG